MARLLIRSGDTTPGGLAAARRADPGLVQPAGVRRPARRWAWRWALLLAVGWLAEFGLRLWFSRAQTVPLANPDESAYLIAARVLAGGPTTDFSYSTLYQGGYPLLITPVYWFTSNAVAVYHAVLVINAAVSAALMPLAYVAGRRIGLVRPAAYTVAAVTALLPAAVFYTEYAMTDAIYPVLVLAFLLTVHSWLTARTSRGQHAAAAGSALLAGYAYAVHSPGHGHRGQLRGRGRPGGLAPAGTAPHGGDGRAGPGRVRRRGMAAEPLPVLGDVSRGDP